LLRARIEEDMKNALKAREEGRLRLSVLRLVWAGIRSAEVGGRGPLDDAGVVAVIRKEIRQREEVLPDYQRAGREADVARIQEEMDLLRAYLPKEASPEEVEAVVRAVVQETGAQGPRDMGKVMKGALARLAGRAQGDTVREVAERVLKG
jgi:uncharacterized protein YqeY